MTTDRSDSCKQLDAIADRLADGMGELAGERTPETWDIRLAAWRLLSKGEPVAVEAIAQQAGRDGTEVQRCLHGSSDVTVDGRIDAVMGLSLRPTQHRIRIEGKQLYTWCALDLLFIPLALGVTAEIESTSPASGESVCALVTPNGVEHIDPTTAVVSVVPIRLGSSEIRGAFCNFVHFFSSEGDASSWRADNPDGWVLPATYAFQLGTRLIDKLGSDCCG